MIGKKNQSQQDEISAKIDTSMIAVSQHHAFKDLAIMPIRH